LDETPEQPVFVVRNGQDVPESLIIGRLRFNERFERARMMIVESADRQICQQLRQSFMDL
jgi:hypothetical protein